MKLKKLERQFILKYAAILTVAFSVMLAVVCFCCWHFMNKYIQENLYSLQTDADSSVTALVDETAYLYARLIRSENSALLNGISEGETYGERSAAFYELVSSEQTEEYFGDVAFLCGDEYFSLNGLAKPDDGLFEQARQSSMPIVLGGVSDGCIQLAVNLSGSSSRTSGVFVFFMKESHFSALLSGFNGLNFSCLISADGYVYAHSDASYAGKYILTDGIFGTAMSEDYTTSGSGDNKTINVITEAELLYSRYGFSCYVLSVFSYNFFYSDLYNIIYILASVAVAAFIVGICLAVWQGRRVAKPIASLSENIESIMDTDELPQTTLRKGDEIDALEQRYDEMIERIFTLVKKNTEDMEIQRKLELDTLQMQINPHFLYNTLDDIAWMAKIKKEPEIEALVLNLAKFFRLSLHKGDKFITVKEEVELTEHYLAIDAIRFPDKVAVKITLDEEAAKYKTLKLVLQPVVENCLKYAFPDNKGNLIINVGTENEDIVYEVKDDGVGFDVPPDILERGRGDASSHGFGLYNINERIKLEYGGGYGVTVTSSKGCGTTVIIRIGKRI